MTTRVKKLLGNRIMVKFIPVTKVGSIHLPEGHSEKQMYNGEDAKWVVVDPGTGHWEKYKDRKTKKESRRFMPNIVKAGDQVKIQPWAGTEYRNPGGIFKLVKFENIIGIVENEQAAA